MCKANFKGLSFILMVFLSLSSLMWAKAVPTSAIKKIREANQLLMRGMEKEALEAVDSCLKSLGSGDYSQDTNYTDILYSAAKIRQSCGDGKGGLEVAKRSLEAAKARKGENNHPVGQAQVAMAMCYAILGDEKKARASAESAWEILGKVPYKDPAIPNLIPRCYAMSDLGSSYLGMEDFLMAEDYYFLAAQDAWTLMSFPSQGASYDLGKFAAASKALTMLGAFYVQVGDYRRAIPLFTQSLEIKRAGAASSMPGSSQGADSTYLSLSRAYRGIGDLKNARGYGFQALSFAARSPVPRRKIVANSVLASVLHDEGDFEGFLAKAEEVLKQERLVRKDDNFMDHSSANNLGWAKLMVGDLAEARKYLTRAYALVQEKKAGDTEIAGNILFSLSLIEFLEGNLDRGVKGLRKSAGIYEKVLNQLIGFGSNSQKLAFLQRLRNKMDFVVGIHFAKGPDHQELARESLMTVFRRKGRMTELARQSAENAKIGKSQSILSSHLGKSRSALSLLNVSLGVVDRDRTREFDQSWTIQLEILERTLNQEIRRGGRPKEPRSFSIESVAKKLQSDEILIEYVVYRPFDIKVPKSRRAELPLRCAALVLSSDGVIKSFDLGNYQEIQQLALAFRRSLSNAADPRYVEIGQSLHARLVAPILGASTGKKRWRIAPDGQLFLIPFGALLNKNKVYLEDQVSISYLTTGKELLDHEAGRSGNKEITILAGPEYSQNKVRQEAATIAAGFPPILAGFWQQVSSVGAPLFFSPLPGTMKEAGEIKTVFPGAKVLSGANATEAAFRASSQSGVIHVASHGFYLNQDLLADADSRGLKRVKPAPLAGLSGASKNFLARDLTTLRGLDNPLLNCGLVFSGANQLYDGRDDGVVTGLEVLDLDLSGTQLVVLSACETGVGEVVTGEGVLGLTQAFRVAGAQSLVSSLWKVSDDATAELMAEFYRQLSEGSSKVDALQAAAKKIRQSEKWKHPVFWSAFVLSGDNGVLKN